MAVTDRNSKEAISHFKVLDRFENYTYLEVKLETGRTHQIRVHLSYLGYPILGDEKYGRSKRISCLYKDNYSMPISLALNIPLAENGWNLKHLCQKILNLY